MGAKLPDNSLSFFADMDADDGRDDFVALGQSDLKKVWSDSEKTSYRINFEAGVFEGCKGKAFCSASLRRLSAGRPCRRSE